jgi:hypothetical protein
MADYGAYILRENTNTSGLVLSAASAAEILAHFETPHLIAGGLAVQEHGYPRVTIDVDIIVPDVLDGVELLTAPLDSPFVRDRQYENRVRDGRNGVEIDLLPAGSVLRPGCEVPFPIPLQVSETPRFVTLPDLVSLKLDSAAHSPLRRLKDKTDVVELTVRRSLPRDLPVANAVIAMYREIWDGIQKEPPLDSRFRG